MKMLMFLLLVMPSFSFAASGPAGFNVQGVVTNSSGVPVTGTVNFTLQVLDKNKTCVLYQEQFPSVNLTLSQGVFSFNLGGGTSRTNNVDTASPLNLSSKVFRNDINVAVSATCPTGVTMASGDARALRVTFDPGTGPSP